MSFILTRICTSSSLIPASAKETAERIIMLAINAVKTYFMLFVTFIIITSSIYFYILSLIPHLGPFLLR